MHGHEVNSRVWMLGQAFSDFFPMMCTDTIVHKMNGVDALVNLRIQRFQKGDEFPLTLPRLVPPYVIVVSGS
jgi:hypothetical protein